MPDFCVKAQVKSWKKNDEEEAIMEKDPGSTSESVEKPVIVTEDELVRELAAVTVEEQELVTEEGSE